MSGPDNLPLRPAARLLLLDGEGRVLLFRFAHRTGALAAHVYWATPGGGVEEGESFADAALRELREETGLVVDDVGPEVARRGFVLQMPDGGHVWADERFFLLRIDRLELSRKGWTELEREVMAEHRWWTMDELASATEQVWPENLPELIAAAQATRRLSSVSGVRRTV